MASAEYLLGRKKYSRPQAMLWADNPGKIELIEDVQYYVPDGYEKASNIAGIENSPLLNEFIVLSDDNRSEINFKVDRIEKRERMINGRMRSYHVADKLTVTTSWTMIPSRAFASLANFDTVTGKSSQDGAFGRGADAQFTTDGGAGGVDLLAWYETHPNPFWVYFAYDKHNAYGDNENAFGNLAKYNQVVEMYLVDFSYSVVKRGSSNYDFWNISVTLEEV